MKWGYRLFWLTTVFVFTGLALTACGKKNEDTDIGIIGPVSVSGGIVTSNKTLNGRQANLQIRTIQRGYTGGMPMNGSTGAGSLLVDLIYNGQQSQMNINMAQMAGPHYPQQSVIADATVWTHAACSDQTCNNVSLIVWLGHQGGYEFRQIGVHKLIYENRIASAIAVQGPENFIYSVDQMLQQLLSNAQ